MVDASGKGVYWNPAAERMFGYLKEKNPGESAKAYALGVEMVRDGHAEARRLIGSLRPPQLEEGGILAAIENLVEESNRRNKATNIEFCCNVEQVRLDPMMENSVFRIVQECITNACRHSKSKKVKVELTQHDDHLHVEVQDWGVGFKMDRASAGRSFRPGGHPRAGQGLWGTRHHLEQPSQRHRHRGGTASSRNALREGGEATCLRGRCCCC